MYVGEVGYGEGERTWKRINVNMNYLEILKYSGTAGRICPTHPVFLAHCVIGVHAYTWLDLHLNRLTRVGAHCTGLCNLCTLDDNNFALLSARYLIKIAAFCCFVVRDEQCNSSLTAHLNLNQNNQKILNRAGSSNHAQGEYTTTGTCTIV